MHSNTNSCYLKGKIHISSVLKPAQGLRRQLMRPLPKRTLTAREIRLGWLLHNFYQVSRVESFRLIFHSLLYKDINCYFYLPRSVVNAGGPSSPQIQNKQSRLTSMTSDARGAGRSLSAEMSPIPPPFSSSGITCNILQ